MTTSLSHAVKEAAANPPPPLPGPLQHLLRLHVPVIVKLAERKMRLAEVVRIGPGTIIEFARPADEPLELMVNNVTIGRGDVVKIGENFGLRINRIGSPRQTIQALGGKPIDQP